MCPELSLDLRHSVSLHLADLHNVSGFTVPFLYLFPDETGECLLVFHILSLQNLSLLLACLVCSVSAAGQVPESATEDDVAEESVKSPKACGKLWIDWCPCLGLWELKLRSVWHFLTLEGLWIPNDRGSFACNHAMEWTCHLSVVTAIFQSGKDVATK